MVQDRRSLAAAALAAVLASGCVAGEPQATAPTSPTAAASPSGAGAAPAERRLWVSPSGDDGSPGTEARPLGTLQAAQAAVRAALAQDPRTNIRVVLASGTYALSATLALDQRDSPADGFTLRFTGPPDASATLSGARALSGWERVSGDIQRARIPAGATSVTVFEDGARATLARTPNEGYLRVRAGVGSTTQFGYGAGELPDDLDPSALSVYVWSGCSSGQPVNYDWQTDVLPVRSVDREARTVTLAEAASYPICAGNRYFFQRARAFLDRPGEFALEGGFVYYWPRGGSFDPQRVLVSTLARLVEVKGASASSPARNIAFEQLTLAHAAAPPTAKGNAGGRDHAALYLENAENVVLHGSRIRDTAGSGVILRLHAQRNAVESSLIERVGVHGVWISGPIPGAARSSRDNRVSNTRIRSGGQLSGTGSGINVDQSAANEIANNEISDFPNVGIWVTGQTLGNIQRFQPQLGATAENLNDLRHARENVIRRNDVSKVATDSQDRGGIYLFGAGPGNRIEENRVHDIETGDRREGFPSAPAGPRGPPGPPGPLLHAIYLDDGSDRNLVRGNLVHGIRGPNANPLMVKGIDNEVSGNVLVNEGGGADLESAGTTQATAPVEGLRLVRNVLVRASGTDVYWFRGFSEKQVAESDRNLFFHQSGAYTVMFRFAAERLSLDEWRARYGLDRASVTADPLFLDPARGDYRVRDGSPALALGFVNPDPAAIGLRGDFPFAR